MGTTQNSNENSDIQDAVGRSLEKSMRELSNTRYSDNPDENTAKLFGLFEMDRGIVNAIEGFWTALSGEFTNTLSPKTYDVAQKYAAKVKYKGNALEVATQNRVAAGAAIGVNLGVMFLPSISKLIGYMRDQYHERETVVRKLAPVLDDIRGKHSMGVFNGIKKEENSVIWAQRQRMSKEAKSLNSQTMLSALAANSVNLMREHLNVRSLSSGKTRNEVILEKYHNDAEEMRQQILQNEDWQAKQQEIRYGTKPKELTDEQAEEKKKALDTKIAEELRKRGVHDAGKVGIFGASLSLPTLIDKVLESSRRRAKTARQPFSAYEMIVCLADQLESNPGHGDRFQLPGKGRNELPLTKYVAEIFKLHQREMCDLDPNSSELRASLHDDLQTLVKPIAKALADGKLSPLMLVRLAGEGKVVKNNGRGLVSPTELDKTLENYIGKTQGINARDPKEYLSNSSFSMAQVKEALGGLQGEERLDMASLLPDGVLKEAGFSDKEIKDVQAHRVQDTYKELLMSSITGMAAKHDDELKAAGISSAQIKQVREAAEKIEARGAEALEAVVTSSTNPDGVDSTALADLVVPKTAAGDFHYMGNLAKQASAEMASEAIGRAQHKAKQTDEITEAAMERAHSKAKRAPHPREGHQSHAEREDARRHAENTEEYGYERD